MSVIDDTSAPRAWAEAIALAAKRKAVNERICDMNARIKQAFRMGVCPHQIAQSEGISVSYVLQIAKRWEQ